MRDQNGVAFQIDLVDLLIAVLKRTTIIIVVSIIMAAVGAIYGFFSKTEKGSGAGDVLNLSVRLSGESDDEYENRVMNVSRAEELISSISEYNSRAELIGDYMDKSLLMKLDPLNTSVSYAQIVITCPNESSGMIEALCDAYSRVATSGDYQSAVEDKYGYEPGAIVELISCEVADSQSAEVLDSNTQYLSNSLTIQVFGADSEFTEYTLECILSEIQEKENELSDSLITNSISVVDRKNWVSFNQAVQKRQLDVLSSFDLIHNQINNRNSNLDSIAKQLGFADRSVFYNYATHKSSEPTNKTISYYIKYSAFGFVAGLIIAVLFYIARYIWGSKIQTQNQFFTAFRNIEEIGVCNPIGKKHFIKSFFERVSSDDSGLSDEINKKIIKANYGYITRRTNRVLITGTADRDEASKLVADLNLKGDLKLDVFRNPDTLFEIDGYDGIVLIEQRDVSLKKTVSKEIELLTNSGKEVLGAILI